MLRTSSTTFHHIYHFSSVVVAYDDDAMTTSIFNKSFKLTNIANYDNIDNITITLIFEQEAYDIDDDIWKNNES